jgi:tetraacyldisaccharide 4'-kinase
VSLVEDMWWSREEPALRRAALAPLALAEALFRAGAAARSALYGAGLLSAARVAAPVISIGNLAVGGSGKTPAAMEVARRLGARGRRVALLSRGYGATRSDARRVSDGRTLLLGAAEAGDEPWLMARRLPGVPVLCGPRRAELARLALADGADALVLDDGFQHRGLFRDLDVVVLDAQNPVGNGRLLPRGPNREGLGALSRAGLAWLSRADQAPPAELERLREAARRATGRAPVESRHAVADVLDGRLSRSFGRGALSGRRVLLLAGIGRPEGFRRTVAGLGGEVALERLFRDHHAFADGELEEAFAAARAAGCQAVVTTEKDAVRLAPRWAEEPLLQVVTIDAEILRGEEELEAALDRAVAAHPTSTPTSTATSTATGGAIGTHHGGER